MTATIRIPIQTPLPTDSPTPQPAIEQFTFQPYAEDGTGDMVTFNELLESLTQTLYEMDIYHYRTLYRYKEGGRYVDGELSVEVVGVHIGLLTLSNLAEMFSP